MEEYREKNKERNQNLHMIKNIGKKIKKNGENIILIIKRRIKKNSSNRIKSIILDHGYRTEEAV